MKATHQVVSVTMLAIVLAACTNSRNPDAQTVETNSITRQKTKVMKSHVSIFEIPATDIRRAIKFYKGILAIEIQQLEFPGMEMGIFPYEDQMVTGVIIKAEGYKPSADGVTLYLNGGDDLQPILDLVEKNGGKIITPKTAHADESGYFAIFHDSEGNKMGLHSPR